MGKKHPVNERTVKRLKDLTEAMESGQTIGERFGASRVRVNLAPQPYSPVLVKETREILKVSQAIFARLLGVSRSAVQQWERGDKPPQRIACRLMDEIRADPDYWKKRLIESMELI